MSALGRFWASTVGKKIVMAVTGLIMVGFLIEHMVSNLLVFVGPDRYNGWAHFLLSLGPIKWAVRGTLAGSLVLHVIAMAQLTMRARAARPVGYDTQDAQVDGWAARTMRLGGLLLLAFIPYHLLHFTTGTLHPAYSPASPYGNLVIGLRSPWVALFYIAAMAALGLHLLHGAWSSFRSLGVGKPSPMPLARPVATLVAVGIAGGFVAIPIAIVLGLLG